MSHLLARACVIGVVFLGCGGETQPLADGGADSETSVDAGSEAAPPAPVCVTDAATLACDGGAWASGSALCSDAPCEAGAECHTLGAGALTGVCE